MPKRTATPLTDAQIEVMARELNVKREEVIEMETRMSGGDVVLDPGPADDGEEGFGPIAYLADATHEPTGRTGKPAARHHGQPGHRRCAGAARIPAAAASSRSAGSR
jgi:DNA-directed RNA polymerase sigma subunit (sigma70/sigma32)